MNGPTALLIHPRGYASRRQTNVLCFHGRVVLKAHHLEGWGLTPRKGFGLTKAELSLQIIVDTLKIIQRYAPIASLFSPLSQLCLTFSVNVILDKNNHFFCTRMMNSNIEESNGSYENPNHSKTAGQLSPLCTRLCGYFLPPKKRHSDFLVPK